MGGSPSEQQKMPNTKNDRAQRYIQNKKGRTSFFLYNRSGTGSTVSPSVQQQVPASTTTGTNQPQIAVSLLMQLESDKNPSLSSLQSQSQPPMLLEMEVVSSSSDSEESSDDNFTSTSTNAIFSSKAAMRRRRRRSNNVDLINASSNGIARIVVEPHIATRVQFSNVEIRSYAITIGDHPCCTIGCPITLDWEYTTNDTVSLQYYETQKYANSDAPTTTKMNDLRISPEERVALLVRSSNSKLTELEIRRASRKFHRSKNCSVRQCERIHETFFHCSRDRDFHEDDDEDDEIMDIDYVEHNVVIENSNNNDDSMSTDDEK